MRILRIILLCGITMALAGMPAHADEIVFKDGRVIKAATVWREGNLVKYDKFGAVMGVNGEEVHYIVDRLTKKFVDSTVYLSDGKDLYCKVVLRHPRVVECIDCSGKFARKTLPADRVLAVLEGPKETHSFFDLPKALQSKWAEATVYLSSGDVLQANRIRQEGDVLVCITRDDRYDIDLKYVKAVKRGHRLSANATNASAQPSETLRLLSRKEKLKRLEWEIDRLLMSPQDTAAP